jgi:CRP/FNR family transcriptional regulator, nitrogen fixation regulation protein
MNAEQSRLEEARLNKVPWKKWGPYLSERRFEMASGNCWNACRGGTATGPGTGSWPLPSTAPAEEPSVLDIAIDTIGFRKRLKRNEELYGANERADYFYKAVSGCVRSCTVVEDGRRLIEAFYLAGDIFGLEAGERHLFSAEAVSNAEILVINRNKVMWSAARENALAGDLWAHVANELHRAQNHLLLFNKSATERVATFLLEMDKRMQLSDENGLPMTRDDIADYLALRSESVSRVLTKLEDASTIALRTTRHVVLRDRATLQRLAS